MYGSSKVASNRTSPAAVATTSSHAGLSSLSRIHGFVSWKNLLPSAETFIAIFRPSFSLACGQENDASETGRKDWLLELDHAESLQIWSEFDVRLYRNWLPSTEMFMQS